MQEAWSQTPLPPPPPPPRPPRALLPHLELQLGPPLGLFPGRELVEGGGGAGRAAGEGPREWPQCWELGAGRWGRAQREGRGPGKATVTSHGTSHRHHCPVFQLPRAPLVLYTQAMAAARHTPFPLTSAQPLPRCPELSARFVPCLPGAARASHIDPLPPQPQQAECEPGGERGHLWVTKVTGASAVSQKGGAVWPGINPKMNFRVHLKL